MISSIKNSSRHNYFIVLLCLYLYLHSPFIPFLPFAIGSAKLLYIPMVIMLFSHLRSFRYFRNTFKTELIILLFIICFVICRTIAGGESFLTFCISALIEIFFLPWFIIQLLIKSGFRRIEDLVFLLLIVGTIGAIISTTAFVIPPINDFIRDNFLYLKFGVGLETKTWRGFGLSSALTSHYSYIQASIVVLYLFYTKNKWFVFSLPFLLLSIIFNARTGLFLLIVGLLIRFFCNFNFKMAILISLAIALVVANIETLFSIIGAPEESVAWLNTFMEEMTSLSDDSAMSNNGVLYTLFEQMVIFPETLNEWVWGRGYSLFGKFDELGIESDIGFINVLSYGGLFYSFLLYSLIIVACVKLKKYKEYWFLTFFVIVFVIINIKSTYLPLSGQLKFMMLVYYFMILYDKSIRAGYPYVLIHK